MPKKIFIYALLFSAYDAISEEKKEMCRKKIVDAYDFMKAHNGIVPQYKLCTLECGITYISDNKDRII